MMTYLEIDGALVNITRTLCSDSKLRLDGIPKEHATERKAVQLEHGMYTFCGNAGLLFNTGWEREKVLDTRLHFWNRELHRYPEIQKQYEVFDENEKMRFFAALQGELFLRDQWLGEQETAHSMATAASDTQQIFELSIKIGAVKAMFSAWEAWRLEHNIYPNMFEED
ncbi:MAG: hypothetical protein IKZ09_00630 [Clostridia bacterium]|nr:hypothetical protein [Clostridia bacterium]